MSSSTNEAPKAQAPSTYALLVGVDGYANIADSDLRGSRTNVVLLVWYCLEVLGVPPQNLRVLLSPLPTAAELGAHGPLDTLAKLTRVDPGLLGEATAENTKAQLDWLLGSAKGEGDSAVFAFSGHGSFDATRGALICLGDTAPGFGSGVLPLRELGRKVRDRGARSRLVTLLDCCHVVGPSSPELTVTALPHTGTAADLAAATSDFDVSDRVVLGAEPGQLAYQMRLGMHAHGALTFALVTAAERWRASGGASHGSYESVLARATRMLDALGVPQRPMGAWKDMDKEPFLSSSRGPTLKEPDARGRNVQIVPNFYTIEIEKAEETWQILAQVVCTSQADYHVAVGPERDRRTVTLSAHLTEHWYVNPDAVDNISSALSVRITSEALGTTTEGSPKSLNYNVRGDANGQAKFTSPENNPWSTTPATYGSGTSYYFKGSPAAPTSATAWLQLVVATPQGVAEIHGVQWYSSVDPSDPNASSRTSFEPTTQTAGWPRENIRLPGPQDYSSASK